MIVEVVAVGTELLLGQIVNSNAATIGAALAENGFDAHFQQVVGDNLERIAASLKTAMSRADAVIVTGGIGPTQDDMTREGLCAAAGLSMEHSGEYEAKLRVRWESTGRVMPPSNIRQADYPRGAELLSNPKGTAPGLVLDHDGTLVFVVPGVPEEMQMLLADHVLPRLRAAAGIDEVLVSRVLRSWGRSESQVADMLDDLYTGSSNPSLAFLASSGEIKLRITAKAPTIDEAEEIIAPIESEIRRRLGTSVFGADGETIESILLSTLEGRGWTLGTAESVTAGGVAERITTVPGSSKVFRGSVVAYATDLKRSLLGVADFTHGVVSEETARAMAEGARKTLGVDVAIAVTGSAGPEPQEQPPGTIVVGIVTPEGEWARVLHLPGDRERVRVYAATAALHLGRLAVGGAWSG